ncbi:SLC13 family permease [Salinibacillus aidingensis]|uniref:SLC13 family permease n=1 Tax=Salinibacillus aidingensis TaxID=237684 RepID=A0ABN1AZ97_9BACI
MTFEMIFVLVMVVAMLAGLLFEVARPDMVIFSVLVIFLITGILDTQEALSGFANQGMLTIALLFIVAGAVQKSGLVDQFMKSWLNRSKTKNGSMLRLLVPSSFFSAFLNNTPIVVTFTPLIKKWCDEHKIAPSKFLIPLSYVTILGGTITLMGTSTNLVVHGELLNRGLEGFSFFQLAVVGVPIALIGIIYLMTVGHKLLPEHKGIQQQVQEESREYIAELVVGQDFPNINRSVQQAGLRELEGLYLIEIIRGKDHISPVRSTTVIQAGDRLIFAGLISTLAELQKKKGLYIETGTNIEIDDLRDGTSQLVEVVVSHQSSLLSKSIKQSRFRSKYDAGVIAVHRNNERIHSKIGEIVLKPGDTLLLLAGPDFIQNYHQSNDFYVVSSLDTPKSLSEDPKKGWFSITVLLAMIVLVALGVVSMFKAMALAVFIFLVTRIITPEEAKGYVQFNVLLIIASSFGIGVAMTKTDLAQLIADKLMAIGQPLGFFGIILVLYLLTNIFTELITNSAAAVLMVGIGLEMADKLQVDPMGFAVTVAISASASFITPIGYQTNTIVYGPGGYRFIDYIKIGAPLSIIVMLTTVSIVNFVWF